MEKEAKETRARATKAKAKDTRPELSMESATIVVKPDIMPETVRIHPVADSEPLKNSDHTALGKVGLEESQYAWQIQFSKGIVNIQM